MIDNPFHRSFSDLDGVSRRTLGPGEILFRQGERADLVFSVLEGELRLLRYSSDGHAVCLHTARDGESFAEAALFTDIYHCNGEATKPSQVWCYPRSAVLQRLREDAGCMEDVFALMAGQVRYLRLLLELRSIRSAPERVIQYLRLRVDGNGVARLEGTLMDCARELGLAHETFYRALAGLEKSGTIKKLAGRIVVLKP